MEVQKTPNAGKNINRQSMAHKSLLPTLKLPDFRSSFEMGNQMSNNQNGKNNSTRRASMHCNASTVGRGGHHQGRPRHHHETAKLIQGDGYLPPSSQPIHGWEKSHDQIPQVSMSQPTNSTGMASM